MNSKTKLSGFLEAALQQTRLFGKTARILWRVSPVEVALLTLIILLQGLLPAFLVYVTKLIVDAVVQGEQFVNVGQLVALWGTGMVVGNALQPFANLISGNLNERLTNEVLLQAIRKANSFPDLEPFENKAFYDDLQTIYNESGNRPLNFLYQSMYIAQAVFGSLGFLFLLSGLGWWAPLLILVSSVPSLAVQFGLEREGFWWTQRKNEDRRMMMYMRRVATTDEFAKEVRLYGLGGYFEGRYTRAFEAMHGSMRALRRRKVLVPMPTTLLAIAGNTLVFFWIVAGVANGTVSAGNAVMYVQSLAQLQSWIDQAVRTAGYFGGTLEFFGKFFNFLEAKPTMKLPDSPQPVPGRFTVRFENVSFSYPDGRKALENLSFEVGFGERVALVGENGAGKTTIVKLLLRLYDPTEGRITVNGTDLRELDLAAWRSAIGAVFQDFVKYQLTARENIAIGAIERLSHDGELEAAARKSGFDLGEIGLETMLGKQFDGTELSGGQWQKLATARAFLREAGLLILDEPSAALDPHAEAALFERFLELSEGKTTFLVTHRLASTTKADRILVLEHGRLIESGTHPALMAANGVYAAMFRVQADQYRVEA